MADAHLIHSRNAVPGAAEDARLLAPARAPRVAASTSWRTRGGGHLDRTDALAACSSGATSGSVRSTLVSELATLRLSARLRRAPLAAPSVGGRASLALPDRRRNDRLGIVEQPHRRRTPEKRPVEQQLALVGTRVALRWCSAPPSARGVCRRPLPFERRGSGIRAAPSRSGNSRPRRCSRSSGRRRSGRGAAAGCGWADRCCCTCSSLSA